MALRTVGSSGVRFGSSSMAAVMSAVTAGPTWLDQLPSSFCVVRR